MHRLVYSVSVELVQSLVSTVVEVPSYPLKCYDDHLTCVPNEEEIRTVLKLMKNGHQE